MNGILSYVITMINPENIMLREIGQMQDRYCRCHLHEVWRRGKFTETESRREVTKGCWEGKWGWWWLTITEFLLRMMKTF